MTSELRPDLSVEEISIEELKFDELNPNKSSDRGADMILNSLSDVGFGRSVLLDKNNRLIGGNQTVKAALKTALKKVRVVETTGDEIIAVKRVDLDLEKDEKARKLSLFDNRTSEVSLNWDPEVLSQLAESGVDLSEIFTETELAKLCESLAEEMDDDGDLGLEMEDDVPEGGVRQFNLFIPAENYDKFVEQVEVLVEQGGYESASDAIVDMVAKKVGQ